MRCPCITRQCLIRFVCLAWWQRILFASGPWWCAANLLSLKFTAASCSGHPHQIATYYPLIGVYTFCTRVCSPMSSYIQLHVNTEMKGSLWDWRLLYCNLGAGQQAARWSGTAQLEGTSKSSEGHLDLRFLKTWLEKSPCPKHVVMMTTCWPFPPSCWCSTFQLPLTTQGPGAALRILTSPLACHLDTCCLAHGLQRASVYGYSLSTGPAHLRCAGSVSPSFIAVPNWNIGDSKPIQCRCLYFLKRTQPTQIGCNVLIFLQVLVCLEKFGYLTTYEDSV